MVTLRVLLNTHFRMSPLPCRLSPMTTARLAGLVVETRDHPGTAAKLFTALDLHAAVLDDITAELRLDSGTVVQFRQGPSPTRIGLCFAIPDLCAAARSLDEQRIVWDAIGPNRIRLPRGGLAVDVTEGRPGLTAVTLFVYDVSAATRLWRSLGLTVTDATPAETDPTDPPEPATDVELGGVTLQLRGCGLRPVTMAHMVIRVEDPLSCCIGLDHAGWDYRRDGEAVVTRTPDGCGVTLTPALRR